MKKILCFMFVLLTAAVCSIPAQEAPAGGMFTISADFSIAFGSVETDYTEKPIMIMGYGLGESTTMSMATARAGNSAREQIGKQAAGVNFRYAKTDSSVLLEFFFTDIISGVRILSTQVLPSSGKTIRVLAIAGGEMPVLFPAGAEIYKISLTGSGNDLDETLHGMMKAAVLEAVRTAKKTAAGTAGILYLSNYSLSFNTQP